MKRKLYCLITLIGIMIVTLNTAYCQKNNNKQKTLTGNEEYTNEWKKIDDYINKGLPKSAQEVVDKIYKETKQSKNAAQFVKAVLCKIKLTSNYEEDYQIKNIKAVEAEIKTATFPVKPVLYSILAELYYGYYQNNRYTILERTATVDFDQKDISVWDARKLLAEIISNYRKSLHNPQELKATNINIYDAVIIKGNGTRRFRPTLYDFLAHRAIDFFTNEDYNLTQPADHFELNNEEYFQPSQQFAKLTIKSKDSLSFDYYAINLLQDLIEFHLNDANPDALIDVELKRLQFVNSKATLPDKDEHYLQALIKLEKKYVTDSMSSEISYYVAQQYIKRADKYNPLLSQDNKWDRKTAYEYYENAIKRFPQSYGAKLCKSVMQEITKPSLTITLNDANVPDKPILSLVNYKNLKTIYFKVVRTDPEKDKNLRNKLNATQLINSYALSDAVKQWEINVTNDGDYQSHKIETKIPALPYGYYILLASSTKDFSCKEQVVSDNSFWVTDISYVDRREAHGALNYYVLNRETGLPMKTVSVKAFTRDYDYKNRAYYTKLWKEFTTNNEGYFEIPTMTNSNDYKYFYMEFNTNKDRYITSNYFSQNAYYVYDEKPVVTTHFFTDRSIYRPGQTVYFKGIIIESFKEEHKINPNHTTKVIFKDVNYQKVIELSLTTNEYGSVSGSFTAPSTGLTGRMTIVNETGSCYFNVEEYKRPKFDVTINPVKGSYKLNEKVSITGNAKAYAGNNIDNAKVKYRVTRQARFPYYCWWWRPVHSSSSMEITNGNCTTNDNGEFKIDFKAIPDLSIDKKDNPVFEYTINVDVTDINGETHSTSQTVSVGYNALIANVDVPEDVNKLDENIFPLKITNLNGQVESAVGDITIYKLKQADKVYRDRKWDRPDLMGMSKADFEKNFPYDIYKDENNITTWEKDKQVQLTHFNTPADSILKLEDLKQWQQGMYYLELKTKDKYGTEVLVKKYFTVLSTEEKAVAKNDIIWFKMLKDKGEPGDKASFLIGSKDNNVSVLYEIELKNKIISKQWISLNDEQKLIEIPITEEHRGNFTIHLVAIKSNRSFSYNETIIVPFTNKKLNLSFQSFRNKLAPGQKEEWKITIKGSKGERFAAELLASMYDASLDALQDHNWYFSIYNSNYSNLLWTVSSSFNNSSSGLCAEFAQKYKSPNQRRYDALNSSLHSFYNYRGMRKSKANTYAWKSEEKNLEDGDYAPASGAFDMAETTIKPLLCISKNAETGKMGGDKDGYIDVAAKEVGGEMQEPSRNKLTDFSNVTVRSNFNETAFFYPQLQTNDSGDVVVSFTVPESLTKWKMMGMAYTKDLKIGQTIKELVTQKDIMVVPNAPRFFRESDKMAFNVKISNISDKDLEGSTRLQFFNAITMQPVEGILLEGNEKPFSIKAGQSQSVSWNITIPEGLGAITYNVVAKAGNFSDGEEMAIPVLTNRMMVTESMPLPINGKQTKEFKLAKLLDSKSSTTLRNHKLTLEFTSNPAWYAVQALPYIMEYPYECSEQTFSRFYANSLASFIANSNPKIRRVFDDWKNISKEALLSNLEKNQSLKALLLEETPWMVQAKNETERKKQIGLLFDLNKMSTELAAAKKKLLKKQLSNGAWPWFDGGIDDRYITQYIVTGFAHLQHLGVDVYKNDNELKNMIKKAVYYLDDRMRDDYNNIKKWYPKDVDKDHIGYTEIQYLYARSFFNKEYEISSKNKEAFNYFKGQAQKYWTSRNKYLQGMIALSLYRYNDTKTPNDIIKSLKENALYNDEMGMYWREMYGGYYWYQAPVESMALLIEAFDEVAKDKESVEKMKIWLLKQKQTQDWKTTKATSEAIYALLLKGTDLLASDKLVEVTIGGVKVNPYASEKGVEAGTGYFTTSWNGNEIKPEQGNITVTKTDDGVAWGAVYWQYFEQLDKITPAETPLKLEKKLFVERPTTSGPVIEPITTATHLKVGDKIKVRIELRVDRDMEYVHLKDMRASAFEPVNVLSSYKYQGGLGYYESTRDASTNFFISYLNKGTYVFEYTLVASQKGDFSNGITSIQCMYAPEFGAHSEGIRVVVE